MFFFRSRWALACLLSLGILPTAPDVCGFALNGYRWVIGADITMHLQLTRPPVNFQDGSASWNASAADALALWNQSLDQVRFVQGPPVIAGDGDGLNSVFFSGTIYGETFGANVLAVTLYHSQTGSGVFNETDVIFNIAPRWDSYRGPLQHIGSTYTYDFHRVALHEFGHALGLDHPDQRGQSVEAVMNSITSDLDRLADDDIAGARSLYGYRITSSLNPPSVRSGDPFNYQITANNSPTSFGASGLPPGFQINPGTGLISGRCPSSGTFPVDLTAQGPTGTATARIQIAISPLYITSSFYPPDVPLGGSFTYQIQASNNPSSFSATGLPAGLSIDTATGIISGIPSVSGTFTVMVRAQGAFAVAEGTVRIVIYPPRITSTLYLSPINLGDSLTYQIAASHNPTSFDATSLPAGLQINSATGLITGAPSAAGYFYITVIAHTALGDATAQLSLNVQPPRITSSTYFSPLDIGSAFTYQITASNRPTSFASSALPAGLRLDPATGRITGVVTLSGSYSVQIAARGAVGDATATLTLTVQALDTPTLALARLPIAAAGSVIADPARARLYVATSNGLVILNTQSLAIIQTIPGSFTQADLHVSTDGNRLWITGYYSASIRSLDLNTLTLLPALATSQLPRLIREGGDGNLYVTDYNLGGVFVIDRATGLTLGRIGQNASGIYPSGVLAISADRADLYFGETGSYGNVSKYRLASGTAASLLQSVRMFGSSDSVKSMAVSPDGQTLAVVPGAYQSTLTTLRAASDLNTVRGSLPSSARPYEMVFSWNGSVAMQTMSGSSKIDVFDANTRTLSKSIVLPDRAAPSGGGPLNSNLAVDSSSSRLFVVAGTSGAVPFSLYVYSLVPTAGTPVPPRSLLNVATRLRAQNGDAVLIGGFIITGSEAKKVLLRATGPSLPVPGKLLDPVLELHASDASLVAENDNWNMRRAEVLATGAPPADEHESAIIATLAPGAYTAVLRGWGETTGVALVELFDLSPASASRVANISTRGKVETGDNVMIGGFIIGGDQPTKVIVRAIGPSLGQRGVAGALADTTLDLHDGNGTRFASNDDWQSEQEAEIIASTVPPTDPRESAIVRTLQPGNYTAIVRGKNETSGVALVEVYNLETN